MKGLLGHTFVILSKDSNIVRISLFFFQCHLIITMILISVHYQKIVHRDIKPSNLLLSETGHVKVWFLLFFKLTILLLTPYHLVIFSLLTVSNHF